MGEVGEDECGDPVGDTHLHHHSISGVVDVDSALLQDARVVYQLELLAAVGGGGGGGGGAAWLMFQFLCQLLRQALRLVVLRQGWEFTGCSVAV